MENTGSTELGTVRIHKDAIYSIAESAALEVEGVSRIGPSINRLFDALGIKTKQGVKVDIDDANEVKIKVFVIVKYGHHLSDVANKVQESIRQAIEKMTDLNLREVNVDIKGMENVKK